MASKSSCAGCQQTLPERLYLTCSICTHSYDLTCANISVQRFHNTMTAIHKKAWQCPACCCKIPKTGNTKTPVRSRDQEVDIQMSTPSLINVTHRQKSTAIQNDISSSEEDSILGDSIQNEVTNDNCDHSNAASAVTLQSLNELIILRLKENNASIIRALRDTITTEIDKAITKLRDDVKKDTATLFVENSKLKTEIEKINDTIKQLENENSKMKEEWKELQHQKSTSNVTLSSNQYNISESVSKKIVLYGLEEFNEEPEYLFFERITHIFGDIINVNLSGYIEETYRIGKRMNDRNSRPLVIELISKRMTRYTLENKTSFHGSGLHISEFLDENARKIRNDMIKEMLSARKQGFYAIIRDNQLFIEGKKSTVILQTESNLWNLTTTKYRNNSVVIILEKKIALSMTEITPPGSLIIPFETQITRFDTPTTIKTTEKPFKILFQNMQSE